MIFCDKSWFRLAEGARVAPRCWQGWACAGGWSVATVLPLWLLLLRGQPVEATIWLLLAMSLLTYEVWQLRKALRREVL